MPISHQLSLRYLKARLRILQRPQVWGTTAGLTLTIAFVTSYWLHPERFHFDRFGNSSDQGYTYPLDSTDSAPSDSLPDLPNPLSGSPQDTSRQQNPTADPNAAAPADPAAIGTAAIDPTGSNPAAIGTAGIYPAVSDPKRPSLLIPAPAPSAPNPFIASPDVFAPRSSLEGDRNNAVGTPSSDAATNLPRTAIDAPPIPTLENTGITSDGIQSQSSTVTLPAPTSPTTSLQPARPYTTSPPPGTTGYTLPSSLVSPATPSANPYSSSLPQPVSGLPASATNTNSVYGTPLSRSSPQTQPFAVPQVPGRPIGNGQVSTFSNP